MSKAVDSEKINPPVDEEAYKKWAEAKRRAEQHDKLWKYLRFIPETIENRIALFCAISAIVFVGGADVIANIVSILEGMIK